MNKFSSKKKYKNQNNYLFARFEFVFNFVLPNFVWANVAVVNVRGAWDLCKNAPPADGAGLVGLPPLPVLPVLPVLLPELLLPTGTLTVVLKVGLTFTLTAITPFLMKVGLDSDVGDAVHGGEPFGLKLRPFMLELTASIGWKHCASGLKVFVTSRSFEESSWCSLVSE